MEYMAKSKFDLFPLGVATGSAHCNRKEERDGLKKSILNVKHTWLWARRRMGKTSLIEQVLKDLSRSERKVVSLTIDLLVVHDAEELERRIRQGVELLGVEIMPRGQKQTAKLAKAFSKLNPQFTAGAGPLKLTLGKPDAAVEGITEVLMGLDAAAKSYQRRVVIVLDEFQQLTQLKDKHTGKAAEGAIRHAVERSKNVTYIFAGSQRHLLASMFEDDDRPLYRLCRKMELNRIDAKKYTAFLQTASKAQWKKIIPDERIDHILEVTSRHPYYVNALCGKLWERPKLPTEKDVEREWDALINEDRSIVAGKVLRLSGAQRAMLKAIADEIDGVEHPAANDFLAKIRLPSSTGSKSKEILEQNDFIHQENVETGEQDNEGEPITVLRWKLVDPIMASYLRTL